MPGVLNWFVIQGVQKLVLLFGLLISQLCVTVGGNPFDQLFSDVCQFFGGMIHHYSLIITPPLVANKAWQDSG